MATNDILYELSLYKVDYFLKSDFSSVAQITLPSPSPCSLQSLRRAMALLSHSDCLSRYSVSHEIVFDISVMYLLISCSFSSSWQGSYVKQMFIKKKVSTVS